MRSYKILTVLALAASTFTSVLSAPLADQQPAPLAAQQPAPDRPRSPGIRLTPFNEQYRDINAGNVMFGSQAAEGSGSNHVMSEGPMLSKKRKKRKKKAPAPPLPEVD